MLIWETKTIDMDVLEAGFKAHQLESFAAPSPHGERNLFLLQAFLSVSTADEAPSPEEGVIGGEPCQNEHGLAEVVACQGDFIIPRGVRVQVDPDCSPPTGNHQHDLSSNLLSHFLLPHR